MEIYAALDITVFSEIYIALDTLVVFKLKVPPQVILCHIHLLTLIINTVLAVSIKNNYRR